MDKQNVSARLPKYLIDFLDYASKGGLSKSQMIEDSLITQYKNKKRLALTVAGDYVKKARILLKPFDMDVEIVKKNGV